MKHFPLLSIAIILLLSLSCRSGKDAQSGSLSKQNITDCVTACAKIAFSESAPQITNKDLEKGSYYGALNQKKKGTPDTWIHILEGTKSASWVSPDNANSNKCDCIKSKE